MNHRLAMSRWSLTARLSVYFALCSGVLIGAMGYILYREHVRGFREEHTRIVYHKLDAVRDVLAGVRGRAALDDPRAEPWREFALPGSAVRVAVFDERGALLFAPSAFPVTGEAVAPPLAPDERATRTVTAVEPPARRYRVATMWVEDPLTPEHRLLVAVALDTSASFHRMQVYHRVLFGTLVAGVLAAALLGYVVARQGLAPLRRIARAANEITPAQLGRRLDLSDAPAELRDLTAAFNAMLDRLAESFARLSQFSSDIAHELRTPLNNLLGEAQVTLARARSADEYRAVVESSVDEIERLSRMVENMLFLARAERPEATVAAGWFDARAELAKVAEFYGIMAAELRVGIECAGEGRVFADPALFRRAVGNLLSNALRHTEPGGEISMYVTADTGGAATISVANPGAPVPPAEHARIFERFVRLEPSRRRDGEGAGLGLAIVQTIMRLHRGTVALARRAPGFNVFMLHFPPPAVA